jgi:hypothetical protein
MKSEDWVKQQMYFAMGVLKDAEEHHMPNVMKQYWEGRVYALKEVLGEKIINRTCRYCGTPIPSEDTCCVSCMHKLMRRSNEKL